MVRSAWEPKRTATERISRAVDTVAPGSGRGRVVEARPVRSAANPSPESLDPDIDNSQDTIYFTQDEFTLVSDGAQTLYLSEIPIENSEHVYWNGVYQPSATWSRNGGSLELLDDPGESAPATGDSVIVEYAYTVTVELPVEPLVIGTSTKEGDGGTISIPANAVEGDLWVAIGTSGTVTCVDSKVVGSYSFSSGRLCAWGYVDSGKTPINMLASGGFIGWSARAASFYRGVQVGRTAVTPNNSYTQTNEAIEMVYSVLFAMVSTDGTVSGSTINEITTPLYTQDVLEADTKNQATIFRWDSEDKSTNPVSSFKANGSAGNANSIVLELKNKS